MKMMDSVWEELKGYGRWLMFFIILVGLYGEYIGVYEAFMCIVGLGIWNQLTIIAKVLVARAKTTTEL